MIIQHKYKHKTIKKTDKYYFKGRLVGVWSSFI